MTRVKPSGIAYRVRVVIRGGAILHVLSASEPVVEETEDGDAIEHVEWQPVDGTEHGDSVGFLSWRDVAAITWRRA